MSIQRKTRWVLTCAECGDDDSVAELSQVADLEATHLRLCGIPVKAAEHTYLADPSQMDDTSDCPRRECCEICSGTADAATVTIQHPGGICCISVCEACEVQDRPIAFGIHDAFERVLEHCGHLGIDLDEMQDAIRQEVTR